MQFILCIYIYIIYIIYNISILHGVFCVILMISCFVFISSSLIVGKCLVFLHEVIFFGQRVHLQCRIFHVSCNIVSVLFRHGVPSLHRRGFLFLREDRLPQRRQWKHHCYGASQSSGKHASGMSDSCLYSNPNPMTGDMPFFLQEDLKLLFVAQLMQCMRQTYFRSQLSRLAALI